MSIAPQAPQKRLVAGFSWLQRDSSRDQLQAVNADVSDGCRFVSLLRKAGLSQPCGELGHGRREGEQLDRVLGGALRVPAQDFLRNGMRLLVMSVDFVVRGKDDAHGNHVGVGDTGLLEELPSTTPRYCLSLATVPSSSAAIRRL